MSVNGVILGSCISAANGVLAYIALRWAYERLRKSLDQKNYDVIVILSPHWRTYVGHHILGVPEFKSLSVDPIFPNLFRYNYDLKVDVDLAEAIHAEAQAMDLQSKMMRNPHFRVDYGTIVSCHLINPKWDKPIVGISSSASTAYYNMDYTQREMFKLGEATRKAIEKSGKQAWKRFQLMEWFKDLHRNNRLNQVGKALIGNFGVMVLLDFPFVSELETLDLRNNDLNDEAVIALSQSEKLKSLVSLDLSKNNISDAGAQALAGSKNFERLKKLNLNFNRIGDEGARAIAESPRLANLESLKLGQNKIGTEGARALNESENLKNLIHPIFGFY